MHMPKIEDLVKFKFMGSLKYSPDSKHLSHILYSSNMEENDYYSDIYLINNKTEPLKLTSSGNVGNYCWKNEGEIIFSKKEKEEEKSFPPSTKFFSIFLDKEEKEVFTINKKVTEILYLENDKFLVKAVHDMNENALHAMSEEERKEQKDYEVLDEIPFWLNSAGFTNKKRNHLYIYDSKQNTLKDFTDEFSNVEFFHLKNDKKKVLFITNTFSDCMDLYTELYEFDLVSEEVKNISPIENFFYRRAVYLKDTVIFDGTDMKKHGLNENSTFYSIVNGKEKLLAFPNSGLGNRVGNDVTMGSYKDILSSDNFVYFIITNNYNSEIMKLDLSGNVTRLFNSKGAVNGIANHNDELAFVGLQEFMLQEVYLSDVEPIQLTDYNSDFLEDMIPAQIRRMDYTKDGYDRSGWIMLPAGYKKGVKFPAIFDIHGGPKGVYGEVYYHEMQVWAAMGYFVFFTNPRGSDGYGNDYMDIRGKYGVTDYEDLMDFTDRVLKEYPEIDEDRIGVTGGSYGGYMTNWIIGHTDRFKCAASQRSIANWISKFGTTDIGYFFVKDQNVHTPWNNFEKLWWHSPMKYADKVKTPTLFIHSEQDYRCWLPEGIQMFTSLKYHGIESKLVIFKGENHELSRSGKPKHRIRRLTEITDWFEKYLK